MPAWNQAAIVLGLLPVVACSRSVPSDAGPSHERAADEATPDACPGVVRGEAVVGLEPERFRLIVEGQPVFPICDACGVSIFVESFGPSDHVFFVHQDPRSRTITGLTAKAPAEGACVRVSSVLGDTRGHPVGRYRPGASH